MELTELLLYRGNFGFNWRPTGGRAGDVGGREWGHWVSALEISPQRRVQGENECGLDDWEEVLRVSCVWSGSVPHLPEMTVLPVWHQNANQVRSRSDGFSSHFESVMTDPRVLFARITE